MAIRVLLATIVILAVALRVVDASARMSEKEVDVETSPKMKRKNADDAMPFKAKETSPKPAGTGTRKNIIAIGTRKLDIKPFEEQWTANVKEKAVSPSLADPEEATSSQLQDSRGRQRSGPGSPTSGRKLDISKPAMPPSGTSGDKPSGRSIVIGSRSSSSTSLPTSSLTDVKKEMKHGIVTSNDVSSPVMPAPVAEPFSSQPGLQRMKNYLIREKKEMVKKIPEEVLGNAELIHLYVIRALEAPNWHKMENPLQIAIMFFPENIRFGMEFCHRRLIESIQGMQEGETTFERVRLDVGLCDDYLRYFKKDKAPGETTSWPPETPYQRKTLARYIAKLKEYAGKSDSSYVYAILKAMTQDSRMNNVLFELAEHGSGVQKIAAGEVIHQTLDKMTSNASEWQTALGSLLAWFDKSGILPKPQSGASM